MEGSIIYESKRKIIYRDGDKAIKTYNDSYAVSQVLNEALNQAKVSEEGICVPKVYEVRKYNGRIGIVMDYIEGENLETIVSKNVNDAEKYIDLFANTYHGLVQNKNLKLNNSYGRIKNKIFASELPTNIKYGLFYKLREMEFSRDIIHGDYTFSNITITKDGKPVIFDWGHVAYGDKKFDIAITYALFELQGRKDWGELYLNKMKELDGVERDQVLKVLILAYVYIVDRYDEAIRKNIYDKIYEIIKNEEA
jgi:tRNA A-37 threonylcarbamoyl transferase component Bud32